MKKGINDVKERKGDYYQLNKERILAKAKRNYKKKSVKEKEESKRRMIKFMKGNTYGKGNKGRKCPEETKRRISKTLMGHKHTKETKRKLSEAGGKRIQTKATKIKLSKLRMGNKNPFYGKKHTKKTLKKQSESHKRENLTDKTLDKMSKSHEGIKCNWWRGGISFEPYDQNWTQQLKRRIRKRDNYICMLCGGVQKELKRSLCVHHVDYNKKNSIKENCISLCDSCHSKTNSRRKYWTKFFQALLKEKHGYKY